MTLTKILTPEQCGKLREMGLAVIPVETLKQASETLDKFALAFHNAKSIHDPKTRFIESHVVRATTYWLSYKNFQDAQDVVDDIKAGDLLNDEGGRG